ncbi:hypothetical protein LD112_07755 [Pantoea agglomerans]|uniref:hypothetical protein n=1 Tax=Enterobacter agglomerans TaxID=549 RepID=UPI003015CA35|nr:hypothetical protein [Pantoea agglomerans]
MLENYYATGFGSEPVSEEKRKRLIVVQAALEIVKASASAAGGDAGINKLKFDLINAANHFDIFVDAIQASIDKAE